ncbi:MAG: protein kinase, partial [Planctomycetes bacterium]|nr:protein kinase [Planctomycetota bacterium]
TGAGTIVGTLQYMAPEQLEGSEADARSDVFAFGALLYEMVTGQRAFEGKSHASLIASIMGTTPPPVSQVKPLTPPGLDRLIKKCLEKDPDDRWQSARDLADELRWIAQSGSQAGIPAPLSAKRRLRVRLAWGIAMVAIVAASALGYLYAQRILAPVPVVRSEISVSEGVTLDGLAGGAVALSPDGSRLTFTAFDTARSTASLLFVRALNSTVALPLEGTDDADLPFWSPDGKQIAFFSEGKLKRILASGGPALTICDAPRGRGGTWNENDVIVFAPEQEGPLFRVAAAGGEARPLTKLDSAQQDWTHRWPVFLPDNDHFLFFVRTVSASGSERDAICLSSLSEPDKIERLINAKSDMAYADGQILFMRDEILMAQPFDAGGLELTGDAVPIAEKVSYSKTFSHGIFSVDRVGNLLYRQGDVVRGSHLYIYSAEGEVIDSIGTTESWGSFDLSHAEDRLAITIQDEATNNMDIWIHDMNRRLRTRFTFGEGEDLAPLWSPDDTRIVWRSIRNGIGGLYTKRTDIADTARLIVAVEGNFWPWQITPDGRDVLYSRTNKDGKG